MAVAWKVEQIQEKKTRERLGALGMVTAAALVGVAIATEGSLSRLINGFGALLWLGSFALNAWTVRPSPRFWTGAAAVLGAALVLAVGIKPNDPLPALLGFGVAGGLVALAGSWPAVTWALLVPGAWLPLHLVIAIGRSILKSLTGETAVVRTDPPPTGVIVPLLMVAAAAAGGLIVDHLRNHRPQPLDSIHS